MKLFIDTVIIGSGCAGFNAADWLYDLGRQDIAIVTEGVNMGTSRNTGSDKQTYYKLSIASDGSDSVSEMAQTLFAGGSVNGDIALIEAACSVKSFIKLSNLGVPFPTNIYGEYVGYKTDHDPRQRATSAGPLTSKHMTECLEKAVISKGINIIDNTQIIEIIIKDNKVLGLVGINTVTFMYVKIYCNNVILATGGPAGAYYNSVYPLNHTGATGLALTAGARASNLQEWQYGLASTKFRWNVSGTYQQVLPKYVAIGEDGSQREFLLDYFDDPKKAIDMVFLKGYQWPFDTSKIEGSSLIDIIIDKEINEKGNRIFMDFRCNPTGLEDGFEGLSFETFNYLSKSEALLETPILRLAKMNIKAIQLYKDNSIDLYNEMLEVAVCSQHCNGGIEVDMNWESSVENLYVAGEAAGTFGVYRPGGSALNSTQVGSLRAAEHIAYNKRESIPEEFDMTIREIKISNESNIVQKRQETQMLMSKHAAYIRDTTKMTTLMTKLLDIKNNFFEEAKISDVCEIGQLYKSYDILTTQISMLSAMIFSSNEIGTRGSGLVSGDSNVNRDKHLSDVIVTLNEKSGFIPVRGFPQKDDWFENVWNDYNKRVEILL